MSHLVAHIWGRLLLLRTETRLQRPPVSSCAPAVAQARSGPALVTGEDFRAFFFFFFLLFYQRELPHRCATVSHPIAPSEQLSKRCENTKPCCFFFFPLDFLSSPPTPLSQTLTPLASRGLRSLIGVGAGGLMNEVFFRSDVKVCSPDTRSPRGEVAGRRPVSTFIHRRSNTDRPAWMSETS